MKGFRGKVAVVTRAGSGIGHALAMGLGALGARGAKLALSDVNAAGLAETEGLARAQAFDVATAPSDAADATVEEGQ